MLWLSKNISKIKVSLDPLLKKKQMKAESNNKLINKK